MGLWVESLENVPAEARCDYYIYLLDYGWLEPIGDAVMKNYANMASLAATSGAVVIRGTNRVRQLAPKWGHWADTTYIRNPKAMKENTVKLENEALEKPMRKKLQDKPQKRRSKLGNGCIR
jgi:hypothetical protein